MGEKLVALIVPHDPNRPPTYTDLDHFARSLLAGYKIPKAFYLTESLPHTAIGKVDKKEMRRMYANSESSITELTKPMSVTR